MASPSEKINSIDAEQWANSLGVGLSVANTRIRFLKTGLGLTLPVQRGANGYFNVSYDNTTRAKTNLINLIMTKKGERVMSEVGCDIHNLVFEQITDDLEANAKGAIQEAVQKWLPYISIDDVQLTKDEDYSTVYITIVFTLKQGVPITDLVELAIPV